VPHDTSDSAAQSAAATAAGDSSLTSIDP